MILIAESGRVFMGPPAGTGTGTITFPSEAVFVGVGMPGSSDDELDFLASAQETGVTGIYLSGIEKPADLEKASVMLRVAEARSGKPEGSLAILAEIGTAQAALAIESFNRKIPRLAALIFHADALALQIGADATSDTIRSVGLKVPLAAKASAALAYTQLGSALPADELNASWLMAKRNGYSGIIVANRKQAEYLQPIAS